MNNQYHEQSREFDPSVNFGNEPDYLIEFNTGDCILERFIIQRLYKKNKTSLRYMAMDSVSSKTVLLTIIAANPNIPEQSQRFINSIVSIADRITNYEYIQRIWDIQHTQQEGIGLIIIIQEYVGDYSWLDLIKSGESHWRVQESCHLIYFHKLCKAVEVLHHAGIPHLNLSPKEVFIQNEDFKLDILHIPEIIRMSPDYYHRNWKEWIFHLVDPLFASPEHFHAADYRVLDTRSDIFGLGILLSFFLHPDGSYYLSHTGDVKREFSYPSTARSLGDYDPDYLSLLTECIDYNPLNRFQSGIELLPILETIFKKKEIVHPSYNEQFIEELLQKARHAYEQRNYDNAKHCYQIVLKHQLKNFEASQALKTIDHRYQQVKEIYHYINQNMDVLSLYELVKTLERANELYPNHPDGCCPQLKILNRTEQYKKNIENGIQALRKSYWESAFYSLNLAFQMNPCQGEIANTLHWLQTILQKKSTIQSMMNQALTDGKYQKAKSLARSLDNFMDQTKRISFQNQQNE